MRETPRFYSPSSGTAAPARWPTHVLQGKGNAYQWSGIGPLSLKLFFGGIARYAVGRGRLAVEEGHYLVLNEGQHYTITIDAPQPVESFCLFFRPGQLGDVLHSLRGRPEALLDGAVPAHTPHFVERTYTPDTCLTPELLALRRCLTEPPAALWLDEQLNGILERLLARHALVDQEMLAFGQAAGIVRAATRDELYRRLHQVRDYLEAEFAHPVTLEELAALACLSPNHLLRSFRALLGTSPHQYLTARRLRAARQQLTHTDLPITRIAFAVGFQSHGAFTRLFTQREGLSPERYRRQFR